MSSRFPPPLPPLHPAQLLRQYGLRPRHSLGQNFLHDPTALERIVAAAEILPDDTVLEIGPGLGALTRYLARAARRVIAVEVDSSLLPPLQAVLAGYTNVTILCRDILDLPIDQIVHENGYLVVANIPYYITSAVLRHLLEADPRPRRLVLTVQKEVAERLCAAPGDLSVLALSVQVYGQPRLIATIPAGAFYPPPKVDSAIVRIDLFPTPRLPWEQLDAFFALVRAGFGQKRKQLRNALAHNLGQPAATIETLLQQAEIDPSRRAETLSLEEWARLTEGYLKWQSRLAGERESTEGEEPRRHGDTEIIEKRDHGDQAQERESQRPPTFGR